jgi:hypothetical protein
MTAQLTIAPDFGALRHDLLARAVGKQLLLRCHRIALASGMFPGETEARIARVESQLRETYDSLAALQTV